MDFLLLMNWILFPKFKWIFLSNFYMDFYFYFLLYLFLNKYLQKGK